MNKHVLRYISVLLPILVLSQSATWDIIQSEILLPNCVVCHDHGTYFTEQSGLNLAPDVAYEGLINQVPTNTAAADDGLTLVVNEGIPSLYSSFLWEKINVVFVVVMVYLLELVIVLETYMTVLAIVVAVLN